MSLDLSRFSICQATFGSGTYREQLESIARAGAAGVGVTSWLMPPGLTTQQLKRDIEAAGLTPTVCGGGGPFVLPTRFDPPVLLDPIYATTGDVSPERSVDIAIERLQRLAALEPFCIVVLTGPRGKRRADEAWQLVVDGLARMDEEARRLGVALALEPVHPRFADAFSIISSLDAARAMLDEIGSSNLGILVDTFHVSGMNRPAEQIARARDRIAAVHLGDAPPSPQSAMDRPFPGEGVGNLAGIVQAIEDTGFLGWYDCEVAPGFTASGGPPPLDVVVRRCVEGFLSVT